MNSNERKAETLFNNIASELSKIGTMVEGTPPWGFGKYADMVEMPAADPEARERFYIAHREEFERILFTLYKFGFHQVKYRGMEPPAITDPDSIMAITYYGYSISYCPRSVTMTPLKDGKLSVSTCDSGRKELPTT